MDDALAYILYVPIIALSIGLRMFMQGRLFRVPEASGIEGPTRELARRARRMRATDIAELREGAVVRVVGDVQRLERWVVAPISKRACAYWSLEVSVRMVEPGRRGYWQLVHAASAGEQFRLADASGACGVEPAAATAQLDGDEHREVVRGRALPASYVEYLEAAGVSVDAIGSAKVRFTERVLAFGETVAVAGAVRVVERPRGAARERGYRDEAATWSCIGDVDGDLLISDARSLRRRGAGRGERGDARTWAVPVEDGERSTAIDVDAFERELVRGRAWRLGAGTAAIAVIAAVIVLLARM